MELVDVLTPHLGGTVEFYQWQGNQLNIVARQSGYTAHVIGSRNLDMAVAADLDSDGQTELLLPNQQRSELGAIRHTAHLLYGRLLWTAPWRRTLPQRATAREALLWVLAV